MIIEWFWLAFIIVFLFGAILSIKLKDGEVFLVTVFLLCMMGLGRLMVTI